jgi:hypothetical protein
MNHDLINVTVIPAREGYKLLWRSMVEDDTTADELAPTWFSDIMGWRIETFQRKNGETYSFVNAVTLDGCIEAEHAIIRPDGIVEVPEDTTLPDITAYVAYVKERDKERAAWKEKVAAVKEAAALKEAADGEDT